MNEAQSVMTFDRAKLHDLEVSIARAKREHVEVFQFYGQTLLLRYAEYMAQYLRQQFGMPPTNPAGQNQAGSHRPKE